MSKTIEAQQILEALGLPKGQQNERSALILLALCNLRENDPWTAAKSVSMAVVGNKNNPKYAGIMRFISEHYRKAYAENSRETFRRQTLHQFVQAGIADHNPENPQLPTNSKENHYRISDAALQAIRSFGTKKWQEQLALFLKNVGSLREKYSGDRKLQMIPVRLRHGTELHLSPGIHNQVQKAIIEEFAPRFAPGSDVVYVGDTANKDLYLDQTLMQSLSIPIDAHNKLPDVVLYDRLRKWIFLVEAVASHGPVSPKRILELDDLLKQSTAGKVYVSAFPDFREFRKHTADIAWETEVWLMEFPEHMIHFNGDKFLGPR